MVQKRLFTTDDRCGSDDWLVVTHPFHPLRGARLGVRLQRRRGGGLVFVCETEGGATVTLPQGWTDRAPEALAFRVSAESLSELRILVNALVSRCVEADRG